MKYTTYIVILLSLTSFAQSGKVLDLNGSKYSHLKISESFDKSGWGESDKTVTFWIKDAKSERVLVRYGLQSNGKKSPRFGIATDDNGCVKFNNALGKKEYIETDANITDGQWHHVAVICSGEKVTVIVDGSSTSEVYKHVVEKPGQFVIGMGYKKGFGSFGRIDNFNVWNVALTREQIKKIKNSPPTNENNTDYVDQLSSVKWENLLINYDFESLSSSGRMVDSSSNGFHGTVCGMAKLVESDNSNEDLNLTEIKVQPKKSQSQNKIKVTYNQGEIIWTCSNENNIKLFKIIDRKSGSLIESCEPLLADEYSIKVGSNYTPCLDVLYKNGAVERVK